MRILTGIGSHVTSNDKKKKERVSHELWERKRLCQQLLSIEWSGTLKRFEWKLSFYFIFLTWKWFEKLMCILWRYICFIIVLITSYLLLGICCERTSAELSRDLSNTFMERQRFRNWCLNNHRRIYGKWLSRDSIRYTFSIKIRYWLFVWRLQPLHQRLYLVSERTPLFLFFICTSSTWATKSTVIFNFILSIHNLQTTGEYHNTIINNFWQEKT